MPNLLEESSDESYYSEQWPSCQYSDDDLSPKDQNKISVTCEQMKLTKIIVADDQDINLEVLK